MTFDPSQQTRWRNTAQTWLAKSVALLRHNSEQERARWLVGYDADLLLQVALDAARDLVPLLNDDEDAFDAQRRNATVREIAAALRAHELAPKLARVEGRTPEEAAAFREAAARLGP